LLELKYAAKFRRDLKRIEKRGKDRSLLAAVLDTLQAEKPLAPKHRDHPLEGAWRGFRECHIENDWVLIYRVDRKALILTATRTGTHADFGW
jgi:mRNA interferase YafQ